MSQLRVARPVSDLEKSTEMYAAGLNLEKIAEFKNHAGFNGCMLGRKDLSWHLEFTQCLDFPVKPTPSKEDLLVLYFPDKQEWETRCREVQRAGFTKVTSFNPYWEINGATFEDHDGYRLVVQNTKWETH